MAGGEKAPHRSRGARELGRRSVPQKCVRIAAAEELARRLRTGVPRVFGRIHEKALLLDLRSVLPGDDERIAAALQQLLLESL